MFGGNMKYLGRLQGAAVVTAVVVGLVGFGAISAQAGTEDDCRDVERHSRRPGVG